MKARTAGDVDLSADQLKAAAESVRELRAYLRGWYRFYNGYDPMFTWWVSAPYEQADEALQKYFALLNEPPDALTTSPPASSPPSESEAAQTHGKAGSDNKQSIDADAPDLSALIEEPLSQMEAIVAKFREDFPGFGGWGGRGRGGRPGAGRQFAGGDFRDDGDDRIVRRSEARDADEDDAAADRSDSDRGRRALAGVSRRGRQNTPEARERMKRRLDEWSSALDQLSFDSLAKRDQVDFLLLKNHISYR